MNNWQYASALPTSPWRGQMSLPRRLSFVKDKAGLALKQEPITAALRGKSFSITGSSSNLPRDEDLRGPYELELHFRHPAQPVFGIRLYSDEEHWTEIGFDTEKKLFYIDRTKSGETVGKGFPVRTEAPLVSSRPYDVRLIVDGSSIEAYAQNGTINMTDLIYPVSQQNTVRFFPEEMKSTNVSGELWELKSIWEQQAR
jgi:fructan beta-fructosidase